MAKTYFLTIGPNGERKIRGSSHDYGYTHAAWYPRDGKMDCSFSTSAEGARRNVGRPDAYVSTVAKFDKKPK